MAWPALVIQQCRMCARHSPLLLWDLQKTLYPGKRTKGRSSFSSQALQAVLQSNIFTPSHFILDGKQHTVSWSCWVLMWHKFWGFTLCIFMPQGHSAAQCGAGEHHRSSPRVTHAMSLGKVRGRLSYEPTRIYISFRIFWGQLPEPGCFTDLLTRTVKKSAWGMDVQWPQSPKPLLCHQIRHVKSLSSIICNR